MKKYLLFIVLFTFIGCASISYESVTQPDQRIQLGGFSFLPPKGENWEVTTDPIEQNLPLVRWGRASFKMKVFKKSIVGPNQKPGITEILKVTATKIEFGIMKFDRDEDLMEMVQEGYNNLDRRGIGLLESNFHLEKFKEMTCVRDNGKVEGGREMPDSFALAVVRYVQGYTCVHPRQPNHIIELKATQEVLKGQTPTDLQNELDHFFNSLKVH